MSKSTNLTRKWLLTGTILTTLAVGVPAFAQDTTPPADDTTATPAAPEAAPADDTTTEVVVTGSRIRHSEYNSSAPVQIITGEKSSLSGMISAAEVLQNSSIAATSGQINNTFTGFVVDGGAGISTLSLRGLGAQRTLVLINGRRMPPAGVGGTVGPVDLNFIPQSLVSRYEILKDGASSIYGSDAVAGVVNIITEKNFEGLQLSADAKISDNSGGESYDTSLLYGKSFDKGNFLVSVDYFEQKALRYSDRDQFSCPTDNYYDADGNRADIIDPTTGTYKCFGSSGVSGYIGTYLPFEYGGSYWGSRVPTVDGSGVGSEGVPGYVFIPYAKRNFNGKRAQNDTVISPVKRLNIFAQGNYRPEWAGGAELYTELMYGQRKSEQDATRQLFPYYREQVSINPFKDAFGGVGLIANPIALAPFSSEQTVDYGRFLGGARGTWGNWNWDAYISTSKSTGKYTTDVIPLDRLNAATGTDQTTLDYMYNDGGVCETGAPAGCVPLDLFSYDAIVNGVYTPQEEAYLFVKDKGTTDYTQTIAEATLTGDLFELPAGPLGAAFGVSFRHDAINDTPGEYSRTGNSWGLITAGQTKGEDNLSEAYFELEAPLLRNHFAVEDFTLNLSGRFSNYDSVGSAWTYKIGFDWAVDKTLRLRGTYGTSFRAPALYELYLNDQTSFLSQRAVDPCINYGVPGEDGQLHTNATVRANCAADGLPGDYSGAGSSAEIHTGGGKDLNPETSAAATFGFVLTPPDTGFKFAVDFWRIKVADQISSSGAGIVGACYSSVYFRSQPGFCDLFTRDLDTTSPTFGMIETIDANYRNIPTEQTKGIDFTTSYEYEFNFGKLSIDSQLSYIKEHKYQIFAGDVIDDYAGTIGDPHWAGDVQTRFKHKDWTLTWTVNYTSDATNIGYYGETGSANIYDGSLPAGLGYGSDEVFYAAKVKPFYLHDLTLRYQAKTWSIIGGVTNLLDTHAPTLGKGVYSGSAGRLGNSAFSSQYYSAYIGRQFYLHFDKNF